MTLFRARAVFQVIGGRFFYSSCELYVKMPRIKPTVTPDRKMKIQSIVKTRTYSPERVRGSRVTNLKKTHIKY